MTERRRRSEAGTCEENGSALPSPPRLGDGPVTVEDATQFAWHSTSVQVSPPAMSCTIRTFSPNIQKALEHFYASTCWASTPTPAWENAHLKTPEALLCDGAHVEACATIRRIRWHQFVAEAGYILVPVEPAAGAARFHSRSDCVHFQGNDLMFAKG
jgi:hypothetical protein